MTEPEHQVLAWADHILLIGGSSATGKSVLGATLARRFGTSLLHLDDIWVASRNLVTAAERPALHAFVDIHEVLRAPVEELWRKQQAVTDTLAGMVEAIIAGHLARREAVVIEGVWIAPDLAVQAIFNGQEARGRVRAVFLYEPSYERIFETMRERHDFESYSAMEQEQLARLSLRYGEELRRAADERGIPIVLASPRADLVDRVLAAVG